MFGGAYEKVKKLRTGKKHFYQLLRKNFSFEAEVIHVNFPRKGNVSIRFCSKKCTKKASIPSLSPKKGF